MGVGGKMVGGDGVKGAQSLQPGQLPRCKTPCKCSCHQQTACTLVQASVAQHLCPPQLCQPAQGGDERSAVGVCSGRALESIECGQAQVALAVLQGGR